jgi:hypothetical protein
VKKREESPFENLYQSIRHSSIKREADRACIFCGSTLKSYKSHFCSIACSQAFKTRLEEAKQSLFRKPKLSRSWDSDPKKYDWSMPHMCPKCGMSFPDEKMVDECKELDENVNLIDKIMGRIKKDEKDGKNEG